MTRVMMKTLNKSKKKAISCGDGRFFFFFLAVAAVLAFVCLLVGGAGFVLAFLSPLLSCCWLTQWERQKFRNYCTWSSFGGEGLKKSTFMFAQ